MKLRKGFRIVSFLNGPHGWLKRNVFACAGWLGTMLVTSQPVLAREVFTGFRHSEFKTTMRRTGWYARKGWPGREFMHDPLFDFTDGLETRELDALQAFLDKRRCAIGEENYSIDMLYLHGKKAHLALEEGDQKQFDRLFEQYQNYAGTILAWFDERSAGSKTSLEKAPAIIADFSTAHAARSLEDFAELMKEEGYNWYVISGTFLGLIRDKGFIPHDYDIDVGINAEGLDFEQLCNTVRQSEKFELVKIERASVLKTDNNGTRGIEYIPTIIKAVHHNSIMMDIFVHYKKGQIRWHGTEKHCWSNLDYSLKDYELAGIPVKGPADADIYLRENYGDWRTPRSDFNSSVDTPNLVPTKNLLSIAFFLSKSMQLQKKQPDAASQLLDMLTARQIITTDCRLREHWFFEPSEVFSQDSEHLTKKCDAR
ncbi:LicD family protein [Kushneria avicenniae]|uniref:LicD family protein n=1 Tax=Kushneria avicenniae TaxID=402385 RepID=A0A1I1IED2_9GAMM|nr:LicD family protein [Kushneria avicenniae]SFC32598.1 LicD family protein [Kushneria avicenniae]